MKEITLHVDEEIAKQAEKLAAEREMTVSEMFSRWVRAVAAKKNKRPQIGPLTREATGLVELPPGKSPRDMLVEALMDKHGLKDE